MPYSSGLCLLQFLALQAALSCPESQPKSSSPYTFWAGLARQEECELWGSLFPVCLRRPAHRGTLAFWVSILWGKLSAVTLVTRSLGPGLPFVTSELAVLPILP